MASSNLNHSAASVFHRFGRWAARMVGHPAAFALAAAGILLWGLSGPLFGFSDTWQLMVNTTTTIVTFLMVFLIQASQNRDSDAIHLKLDEIIRATQGAHNAVLNLEDGEEDELKAMREQYAALAAKAKIAGGEALEVGTPDLSPGELA